MILLNINGNESIYQQIKSQILRFIHLGVLKPNEKLPSVRMLAQDLGINPNTVARAYAELEEEGFIYTMNKKGVYVSGDEKADTRLLLNAEKQIQILKEDGLDKQDLLELIEKVYGEKLC